MMLVMVTGSRYWDNQQLLRAKLTEKLEQYPDMELMHGGCPTGADAMAEQWARDYEVTQHIYYAKWRLYGRSAGPKRNTVMVASKPGIVLGFLMPDSRGTRDALKKARAQHLLREIYTDDVVIRNDN